VASPQRLVDFEAELLPLERAQGGRPLVAARLQSEAVSRLRGIGGLATGGVPERAPATRISELARRLAGRPESVRGIWVRQLTLVNPIL
jgi:hypothetical protein